MPHNKDLNKHQNRWTWMVINVEGINNSCKLLKAKKKEEDDKEGGGKNVIKIVKSKSHSLLFKTHSGSWFC